MKISEILESHRKLEFRDYDPVRHRVIIHCACGTRHPAYEDGRWPTHEEHVAALADKALKEAQAEAWEEGWDAAIADVRSEDYSPHGLRAPNPYNGKDVTK